MDEIEAAVRRHYSKEAPGAALHAARLDCEGIADMKTLLARLGYETVRVQGRYPQPDPDVVLMDPLVRFCDSCGQRPAVHSVRLGDDADLLCHVCERKGDVGKQARYTGALARFADFAKESRGWSHSDVELPDDLAAIGDTCESGDIALILADGNRLGRTLRHLTSIDQYRAFSHGVAEIVEEAVFDALADATQAYRSLGDRAPLPWEIIFLGGGNVLIATAADIALPVALNLMEQVEEKSEALLRDWKLVEHRTRLTMAAGVAIAPSHMPIRALHGLAQQLEGSAKDKAYAAAAAGE